MDIYLTSGDIARRLGISDATVEALVARRELAIAARTESGIRLFRSEDVDRVACQRPHRPRRRRWYEALDTEKAES